MKRIYHCVAYWVSWALFGIGGLVVNLAFLPLYLLPESEGRARFVRTTLSTLFRIYIRILDTLDTMRLVWTGFDGPLPPRTIYVANHPGLLDAPILISRLRDAVCVFKPKLLRNPATGPVAVLAGYASGGGGIDAVRDSAARVAAGRSLVIFPEGTRTAPDAVLQPIQAGFALIAARAQAPVQLIVFRATKGMTTRGQPWWKVPAAMPTRMQITLDRRWEHDPQRPAARLALEVEQRLREVLSTPSPFADR
ncbi:lysophospholipid acyltransferase family protein [Opitutales bacterium ASA1]|uniref:lysophospholipid acyltransferase family protein n=1 Tax=Congregicoccus parvus TaxID=3081749 RepID=UPI002B2C0A30|nr:lysophospholipid acyltransferase family protein [Opitutales bacterium ASA1]